jgi:hypothetical protein
MVAAWLRSSGLGSTCFAAVFAPVVTVNPHHKERKLIGQGLRQVITRPERAADVSLDGSVKERLLPGIALVPHDTLGQMDG